MPYLPLAMKVYLLAWMLACCAAFLIVITHRRSFGFLETAYWRFLLRPWRVILFGVALAGMVGLAPHSGDPTWDYVDGAFMSVLAYTTAPWAIGALYRCGRFHPDFKVIYVALCLWLFSASWSYDLYILLRDGIYPPTWLSNLVLSSMLYFAAGFLWNLTGSEAGPTFAFLQPDWFQRERPVFNLRLLLYALPFILLAAWITIIAIWDFGIAS